MALVRTTLTAATTVGEPTIAVAAATGIAAGSLIQIDAEFMQVQSSYVSGLNLPVLRGRHGSASLAHASGAGVVAGTAADFANPPAQSAASVNLPANRVREIFSYSAAGAIANPKAGTDAVAILNGTTLLAMTLGNPGKDNDGDVLFIVNNGAVAHTVTYTGGFGGVAASDVVTFPASPGTAGFMAIACNERWLSLGGLTPA